MKTVSRPLSALSVLTFFPSSSAQAPLTTALLRATRLTSCSILGVCLAYFESKFNPVAVYENLRGSYTGFGLFQIRDIDWCDRGKNLCHMSCSGMSPPSVPHWGTGDHGIELGVLPS